MPHAAAAKRQAAVHDGRLTICIGVLCGFLSAEVAGTRLALLSAMYCLRRKTGASAVAAAALVCLPWLAATALAIDAAALGEIAERYARDAQRGSLFAVHAKAAIPDDRLRLPDCTTPIDSQLPVGARWSARTLVQLRCNGNARWSLLIPIDMESDVPVLVLRQAALRGSTPAAQDLREELRRVPGTSADYVNSPADLLRQHLRRAMAGGSVLTPADLEPDLLVHRGQTVSVLAETAGMSLRTEAIAMADARAGDRLRLQNRSSLKVFEGLVDNDGKVRVSP